MTPCSGNSLLAAACGTSMLMAPSARTLPEWGQHPGVVYSNHGPPLGAKSTEDRRLPLQVEFPRMSLWLPHHTGWTGGWGGPLQGTP